MLKQGTAANDAYERPTVGQTDKQTVKPSCRDERTHLKKNEYDRKHRRNNKNFFIFLDINTS